MGIDPSNLFLLKFKIFKCGNFAISSGITPYISLSGNDNSRKFWINPNSDGNVPFNFNDGKNIPTIVSLSILSQCMPVQ